MNCPLSSAHTPPSHQRRGRRGFALIATISIMVLLALIAVGLLSLSSVSIRSATKDVALAEARANAKLGLMVALGELQTQLGPDQRVTAESSLKNESYGKRGHWMGAYESWLDTTEERPDPVFLRWLVSGEREALQNKEAANGEGVANAMVDLVSFGTLGGQAPDTEHVEAGLVKVGDKHRYAWWIGDENTKAHAPHASAPPASMVKARTNMMSAPQAGIERIPAFNQITRDEQNLGKAFTLPSLGLVGDKKPGAHFHDVTTESRSLITNVRKGGFRKDLSMALETNQRDRPTEALYTVEDKKGITLGELWDYYHLWKEVDYPSRAPSHPDGRPLASGIPVLASKRDHQQAVKDPYYAYRRLTILRASWVVSLMTLPEGKAPNSRQLYFVLDPILTVWNPFDVAITIDRRAYQGFKYWGIPYKMNLTAGAVRQQFNINDAIGNNFIMKTLYGRAEPIVLRPGEVQVISQGTKDSTVVGRAKMEADLRLGWNFGSGFRFKVKDAIAPANAPVRWSLLPRDDGHMTVGLIEFLHYQGTPNTVWEKNSVWVGGLMVDRNLHFNDSPLQATDAPKYFPRMSSRSGGAFTMGSITNQKRPVMMFSLDMKTETDPIDEGLFQGRFHLRHNPKLGAYDIQSFDDITMATMPMQISVKQINSWKDPILDVGATGLGYAGGGYTAEFGNSQIITHSIPREPIFSLAAFQHSVGNGAPPQHFDGQTIKHYYLYPSISHAIGNSFAPSFLKADKTEGTLNTSAAADHSYLANEALWDDWFFSSIAPQTSKSWQDAGEQRNQRTVLTEFVGLDGKERKPLPNTHMQPWVTDPQEVVDALFAGSRPKPEATERMGAHMTIEGGFNVNSTSVLAWRALFSSLRKQQIPMLDALNPGKEQLEQAEGTPSSALLTAGGPAIPEQGLGDPKTPLQWRGFRDLSDYQIDELAEAMVEQVRERGPFLSRADFVNRRLEEYSKKSVTGALQAALDDDEVSINQEFLGGAREVTLADATAAGLPFPEAEAGAAAAGIPGYVKQADILTSIGPLISVRGDTFRIRAYGESLAKDGTTVLARAWCEAVVQRVPDYMNQDDENWTISSDLTNPLNQRFGRRFKMTQFRWLRGAEV